LNPHPTLEMDGGETYSYDEVVDILFRAKEKGLPDEECDDLTLKQIKDWVEGGTQA
jgi:hypothetical protein